MWLSWGGSSGGCIPPPAIFKYVFDEYYFSIISNVFDNNKLYALQARVIENVQTKCIIFSEDMHYMVLLVLLLWPCTAERKRTGLFYAQSIEGMVFIVICMGLLFIRT